MRILETIDFEKKSTFNSFISEFYESRLEAKAKGDVVNDIFNKLIMNSAYGKFATNPNNFKEYMVQRGGACPNGWELESISGENLILKRPTIPRASSWHNVATGASITGASRAKLLLGLAKADTPLYCDTDSIICKDLDADKDAKKLGAWKTEAHGDTIYIAGKKTYAVFSEGEAVKWASKGVRLAPEEIARVATGETIEHHSPVPTFKLNANHIFQKRKIRTTQTVGAKFKGTR